MGKEITLRHVTTDYFLCGICKLTINEAVECRLCEKLFCNSCLVDYLNNSQDSCCPLGCADPTFERSGHALEKLMSFLYTKCRYSGCPYEDCIKYIYKHEQQCRFRQEKMEIEVNEDILLQRDKFWLQILNKLMTPTQPQYCYSQCPTPILPFFCQDNFTPGSLNQPPHMGQSSFKF